MLLAIVAMLLIFYGHNVKLSMRDGGEKKQEPSKLSEHHGIFITWQIEEMSLAHSQLKTRSGIGG